MFKQSVAFVSIQLRLLHTTSSGNETLNLANCCLAAEMSIWCSLDSLSSPGRALPHVEQHLIAAAGVSNEAECMLWDSARFPCPTQRFLVFRLGIFFLRLDSTLRFPIPFPDPGLTPHPRAERRFGRLSKCKEILGSPRHSLLPPLRACLGRSERRHRLPAYSGVGSYFCNGI